MATHVLIKMDFTKYNLRCNRSISEKMMKKDFIYDMRPPQATLQKSQYAEARPSAVTSLFIAEKHNVGRQLLQSNVIAEVDESGGSGDACMSGEQRILGFACNFCYEPIATLSSLSTHVKSHRKKYCTKCYWILDGDETIEHHNYFNHQILSHAPINFHKTITSSN